jgi:hypothetical protein
MISEHAAQARVEPLWPIQITIVIAIILYVFLPSELLIGPRWAVPILEGLLLVGLISATPGQVIYQSRLRRFFSISLAGLITIVNIVTVTLLVHDLLSGGFNRGDKLILAALQILFTNIIIFGLWYWEMDRGGPGKRSHLNHTHADFLFTQMANPQYLLKYWYPTFIDYLYLSVTNATAFSPTDTMPLSHRAKALMTVQSVVSLVTIVLVAARAIDLLV